MRVATCILLFPLCVLLIRATPSNESVVSSFFKLVHSEAAKHGSDVKLLTRKLYEPYTEMCLKVQFCDDDVEFIRLRHVRELRQRLRVLDIVELILWRLRQRRDGR